MCVLTELKNMLNIENLVLLHVDPKCDGHTSRLNERQSRTSNL